MVKSHYYNENSFVHILNIIHNPETGEIITMTVVSRDGNSLECRKEGHECYVDTPLSCDIVIE